WCRWWSWTGCGWGCRRRCQHHRCRQHVSCGGCISPGCCNTAEDGQRTLDSYYSAVFIDRITLLEKTKSSSSFTPEFTIFLLEPSHSFEPLYRNMIFSPIPITEFMS